MLKLDEGNVVVASVQRQTPLPPVRVLKATPCSLAGLKSWWALMRETRWSLSNGAGLKPTSPY